jgi:gliding motility-associated-like protein
MKYPASRYLLLLAGLFIFSFSIHAQTQRSNKGKEFWLGYGHNVLFTQGGNTQNMVLYLSAESAANVTVSVNGTSWSQTVAVPANTVDISVTIPKTGADDARIMSEGVFTRGIHIVSDTPIVVYAHQQGSVSSGATMLMPVETYGYTYYSLNFTQVSNYPDSYSWFFVIASADNTRIQLTPSANTEGGWLAGQTYTVNLNKGEGYNVFGKKTGNATGEDLSGSKIVSVAGADGNCHPVAVFSGSSRNIICSQGNGGEVMQQQIFPANAWGTRYLTYHTVMNPNGDISGPFLNYYRVAVRKPGTIVKRNGVPLTGLINNFYYEFTSDSGDFIEADAPILVAQYAVSYNQCVGNIDPPLGDPEMLYLSPIEQGVRSARFYATRKEAIDITFINIIIPQTGLASLRIDGTAPTAAERLPHPADPSYAVVVRRFLGAPIQHSISSDSSFIASVYGAGYFESYGYNMGTMVNDLNSITNYRNTLNSTGLSDTMTCPNSPFRLTVQLAYKATSINWRLSQVPGLFPNTDSVFTNPVPSDSAINHGRKYYTYTLQQDFTLVRTSSYEIPIEYTSPEIDACNQTEYTSIRVVVKEGPKPDFTITDPACLNSLIQFTGTSNNNGFAIRDYLWRFTDNSTASTINTSKQFTVAGNQVVNYRLTTSNGCIGDTTKTIVIHPNPAADFTITGAPFCTGKPVTIRSSLTGITQWNWDLGNGSSTATPSFTHQYNSAGTYSVSLTTNNAAGCVSEPFIQNLQIAPTPQVIAGPDTTVRAGTRITLPASISPAGNYQYTWTPSTYLNSASVLNPVSTPILPVTYNLQVTSLSSGCTASGDIIVTAVAGLFIPNAFTPNDDGKNDRWTIPGLALYPGSRVAVFNRAGQLMYQSSDYTRNPWDGRYRGQLQPTGLYIYLVELKDTSGQILKGTLSLIR